MFVNENNKFKRVNKKLIYLYFSITEDIIKICNEENL